MRARPAARNSRSSSGPLSPMSTAAAARSATTAARSPRSTPLSRPPAIRTIGASNARSAAMTASGCVPCESLTKRTPSISATRSSRCSTPVERRRRAADSAGLIPNRSATAVAARAFETLCAPGDPELGDRHDAAALELWPRLLATGGRATGATGNPIGSIASATSQPCATPSPPGGGSPWRYRTTRALRGVRVARHDRVVGVQDQGAGRVHELREPALDRPVRLQRPVPVEVVGGDVRVRRDGRAARQRRQLQLGELDDDAVARGQLGQPLDERPADVPAEDRRMVAVGREQRMGQRGGRRLALRAGDPDRRRRAEPQEQVDLGHDRRRVRVPARAAIDDVAEGGPQARLRRRVVGVDRRRCGRPAPRPRARRPD